MVYRATVADSHCSQCPLKAWIVACLSACHPKAPVLTADTITDEQIRELRESDPNARHAKRAAMYARALGRFVGATPEQIQQARARCAAILNNRGDS